MARTKQVGDGLQRRLQHAANKLASVRDSLAQVLSRSGCVPGIVGCLSSRSLANNKSSCEDHLAWHVILPSSVFALAESDRCIEDMHAFVVVLLVSARLIKEDMDIHIDLSIHRLAIHTEVDEALDFEACLWNTSPRTLMVKA